MLDPMEKREEEIATRVSDFTERLMSAETEEEKKMIKQNLMSEFRRPSLDVQGNDLDVIDIFFYRKWRGPDNQETLEAVRIHSTLISF